MKIVLAKRASDREFALARHFSHSPGIPANFFWDIGVRFEDHTIISEDSRWSPKSSEESRSLLKTSEVLVPV